MEMRTEIGFLFCFLEMESIFLYEELSKSCEVPSATAFTRFLLSWIYSNGIKAIWDIEQQNILEK